MQTDEIRVPQRLGKTHPYVAATREALSGIRASPDRRLELPARKGIVQLATSRVQVPRSLRILQAIFAEAERRGWAVQPVDRSYGGLAGVAIVVDGHAYRIKISEQTDRVPLTEEEVARWKRVNEWRIKWSNAEPPKGKPVANGRLQLSIPSAYGSGRRSNWADGSRGLVEGKLPSVFRELEERAMEDTRRAEERGRRQDDLRREREERERRARLLRSDRARAARLTEEVAAWQLAADARAYVSALRSRLPELEGDERKSGSKWCTWAADWADRSDPVRNPCRIVGVDDAQDAVTAFRD
jgi:hypothetical protein